MTVVLFILAETVTLKAQEPSKVTGSLYTLWRENKGLSDLFRRCRQDTDRMQACSAYRFFLSGSSHSQL